VEGPHDLPDGWKWSTLGDVCDGTAQIDPRRSPTRQFRYIDISAVDNKANRIAETRGIYGADAPSRARKPVRDGDVLFSTVRTYLRNVAQVPPELDGQIASTGFCVLRAGREVEPRFLFRYLLTDEFIRRVSELQRGISYPAITDRDVFAQPIPIPPLPEQLRLVENIERLLEQSRTAREALDRIPPLLKRFRQAVLAKAFRGELTKREPDDEPASVLVERLEASHEAGGRGHGGKAAEPSSEGHDLDKASLPNQWAIAELKLLCEPGRPITYGILKPGPDVQGGVPYVRVADYPQDRIALSTIRRTTPSIEQEYRRSRLRVGDLLLSIRGTYGRVCSVPPVLDGANITQDSARIAVNSEILPEYIEWFLRSPDLQRRLRKLAKGVAVKGVNIGDVRALRVPLPPRAEQRRFVARVDALLARADAIEEAVAKAGRQSRNMDQSVLARAFRGEL
jgi:type I restriction enzyme S subunit